MKKPIEYSTYKLYPMDKWNWPNFTPFEMRSKGDGKLVINAHAMDKLQALRELVGPISITSAYRSPAHNKKVGGAKGSQHLQAKAFDCQMGGHDPAYFEACARRVGFTGFGFYEHHNFMHVDIGPPREWNDRWFDKYTGPVPRETITSAEIQKTLREMTPSDPAFVLFKPAKSKLALLIEAIMKLLRRK